MRKVFKLLGISVPVFHFAGAMAASCPDQFKEFIRNIPVHIEYQTELTGFPDNVVHFLGEGFGGGRVYLVRAKDGSNPFVIKEYFSGRYSTTNDAVGLQIVEAATAGNTSSKQIRPVKVFDRLDETTLKLEHAPGTDFHRLASMADPASRARLARLFLRQIEALSRNLKIQDPIEIDGTVYEILSKEIRYSRTPGFKDLVVVLTSKNQSPNRALNRANIELWIKPENVVMTSDGRILVIDPK